MACLWLLQVVLLVFGESYLYLWISYYQYFLKVNLWKVAVYSCDISFHVIFTYSFDIFMISKRLTNYFCCFFCFQFPVIIRSV